MMYLCVIFASPLYFVTRQKWGGFILNACLYGMAWLCLITILGAWIAPLFWVLGVGHASWHLRTEIMHQHAELIATKMAEQFKRPGPAPLLAVGSPCPDCGTAGDDQAKFCINCGRPKTVQANAGI